LSEDVYWSIPELARRFKRREVSPVEIAQATLTRIELLNGSLNAFSQVRAEITLTQARESEKRWLRNAAIGPLDGIPFSVKDTLVAQGYATRRGSRITSNAPAAESAPIVARMLEQGAVVLGITTTPEFGGGPVTISPLTGVTRNPWNLAMTSGGSSGGAAASIAAGIGVVGLATDAGGSIRTPAALTGVFGFKATGGRIPTYPANVAGGLSSAGPITRSVRDAAIVLNSVARLDLRDPEALPDDGLDYLHTLDDGVAGLRIAFSPTLGYAREVDPEVAIAVRGAAAVFSSLGAIVEETDPPIEDPLAAYKTIFMAGYFATLSSLAPAQAALLGETMRAILEQGRATSLLAYMDAQAVRRSLATKMMRFHERYDLLLTPAVAVPAFEAERWEPRTFEKYSEPRAWVPFGYPFNLTQQPAASIPCGLTRSGLPIGLQIVGRRFEDVVVLRAAQAFETAGEFSDLHPPLATNSTATAKGNT
jgi:aspartyl-tRNA(Asn)/glutamyl-tRNA(Gln) amidotransferase subunit A